MTYPQVMHKCKTEITITDRFYHHKARWLRRITHFLKAYGDKCRSQAAEITIIRPEIPRNVLNALIRQGFSLIMKGNLANYRENPIILKGKRRFTLVNEGEFWWAVPVEGEIVESIRLFPFPPPNIHN